MDNIVKTKAERETKKFMKDVNFEDGRMESQGKGMVGGEGNGIG